MEAQARAEKIVETMISNDAFSAWLGLRLEELRAGNAVLSMSVRPEMVNGFGRCHGGVLFALADSALAFAANTHGRLSYTVESNIVYLKGVFAGDTLRAEARELGIDNDSGMYEVTMARQDGVIVSVLKGKVYRTDREFFAEAM